MEHIADTIGHTGNEQFQQRGLFAFQFVEDRALTKLGLRLLPNLTAHGLEQSVTGRDPFEPGVRQQCGAVETNPVVAAGQIRQPPVFGPALVV